LRFEVKTFDNVYSELNSIIEIIYYDRYIFYDKLCKCNTIDNYSTTGLLFQILVTIGDVKSLSYEHLSYLNRKNHFFTLLSTNDLPTTFYYIFTL